MITDAARADIYSHLAPFAGQHIGVAVSGGGDSVALLRLLLDWGQAGALSVATVDHGLRDGSASEADFVGDLCAAFGLRHSVLNWGAWDGQGNLMAAARDARRDLLRDWAIRSDCRVICLGHTMDDQAETFLMRLARGSGVDGLSAMQAQRSEPPIIILRPLLGVQRSDLRSYLTSFNQSWIDDPTNEDQSYDRIRLRKAAPMLADLGLTAERLASTATQLQRSRRALEHATDDLARAVATPTDIGSVKIDRQGFEAAAPELRLRLLAHSLRWITGARYRPRLASLTQLDQALVQCGGYTLAGCRLMPGGNTTAELVREAASIAPTPAKNGLFSGVWKIDGLQDAHALVFRCLGEDGLGQRPAWRNTEFSRAAIVSSPSLWYGPQLKSAPFLDRDLDWTCTHLPGRAGFFAKIVSH